MSIHSTEAKINNVLSTIKSLEDNLATADDMKFLTEVGYPQLLKEVASISERMPTYDELSDRSKFRLDNISDATVSYAKLDFSFIPFVNENPIDHFDFIGTALNMMRYEMQRKVEKLSWYKNVFNALCKPILITDADGVVLESNEIFHKFFNNSTSFIGRSMKELIADGQFDSTVSSIENEPRKYGVELEPMFSSVKGSNGKETGRIYTFKVEIGAGKSVDKAMTKLKDQLLKLADKFTSEVNEVVNVGMDKSGEKEKFLQEIQRNLSDKKSVKKLTTTEAAWLSHLQYLLD